MAQRSSLLGHDGQDILLLCHRKRRSDFSKLKAAGGFGGALGSFCPLSRAALQASRRTLPDGYLFQRNIQIGLLTIAKQIDGDGLKLAADSKTRSDIQPACPILQRAVTHEIPV